jgi:hypothetical protein
MSPSLFGAALVIAALWVWRRSASVMLVLILAMTLFGGAAAIYVTALGDSSIPPADVALGFLALRLIFSPMGRFPAISKSVAANGALALFVIYGLVAACFFPVLFAGSIDVVPQIGKSLYRGNPFDVVPLAFASQNITQAVYLLGTLIAAICAYLVARREERALLIAKAGVALGCVHVAFGVADMIFYPLNIDVLDFFRNGNYAQLSQETSGFHRIAGVFPEASAYAAYGFMLLVFNTELWLRGIVSRWSGAAALALGLVLFIGTSSSAYVGLAGYALILALRLVFVPGPGNVRKLAILGLFALTGCVALFTLSASMPSVAQSLGNMLNDMSVGKAQSLSGQQRSFWAREAIDAFVQSFGLGIGPGSFRSSSLATAVLGATGAFGAVTLLMYFFQVLAPLRRSTYALKTEPVLGVGRAAAWAAVLGLLPAFAAAPTPDPGVTFAIFSGIALAWRRRPLRAPRYIPAGLTSHARRERRSSQSAPARSAPSFSAPSSRP